MVRRAGDGVDERIEADLDFHRTLARLSGNDTLLHSWTSLERAVANMNTRRHLEIVDAIESGEPARVTETVLEHMDDAADMLVSGAA